MHRMGGKNPKSKSGQTHFSSHSINISLCMCIVDVDRQILPLNKPGVVLCHYSRRDFILNWFPNLANLFFSRQLPSVLCTSYL